MPFNYNICDCSPLVIDKEFEINDENKLAKYVGMIILGHFTHVKNIINTLAHSDLKLSTSEFDLAISKLKKGKKTLNDIEKRDGWIFQIMSWLSLFIENKNKKFFCQQPHDAPAQHGLDGVGLLLDNNWIIEHIIITEDKCTENHRVLIPKVWKEFEEFENDLRNNQLVSRISALIENLNNGTVLEANRNDIYNKDLWQYRIGINRNDSHQEEDKRKKLFKGYDDCVSGTNPHRRYASTLNKEDIRNWMEEFSKKVIQYLETQKNADV